MTASITRRDMVTGMGAAGIGLAGAALGAAGSASAQSAEGVVWDREVDAIVIGAGAGGDLAALTLADEGGLSVLLLECLDVNISSSGLSGGDVTLCETEMAPGSRDDLFNDLVAAAQGDCQEDLVRTYVDHCAELYEKLGGYDVHFYRIMQDAYMSQAWMHAADGDTGFTITEGLEARIAEREGIELLMGNRARALVMDGDRVVGVRVETAEGDKYYRAGRGVVIACGSFTQNHELAKAVGRRRSELIIPMTGVGDNGDGLFMGLAAGADVSYLGVGVTPIVPVGLQSHMIHLTWMTNGGIMVGLNGRRFHNEEDNYTLITQSAMDLEDCQFFIVYDAPQRALLGEWDGLSLYGEPVEPEIVGDTLEDLATAIAEAYPKFDAEAFAATVAAYNGYVADGNDAEFGRTTFNGALGELVPIEQGPFYAIPCTVGTTTFSGGLKVDADLRVVGALNGGQPIPGLYATGSVTGGFHGYGLMSGTPLGKTLIFGMVAARTLIADSE